MDGDRIIPEPDQKTLWYPIAMVALQLLLVPPLHLCLIHSLNWKGACAMVQGVSAKATERRKHTTNDAKYAELCWQCIQHDAAGG